MHRIRLCRVHTGMYAGVRLRYLADFKNLLELPKVTIQPATELHPRHFPK
jgi:hypothetical protein